MRSAHARQGNKGGHLKPEEIMAYADGELSPDEAARVEGELEQDPAAMALLGEYFRQRLLLAVVCREAAIATASDKNSSPRGEPPAAFPPSTPRWKATGARGNLPATGQTARRRAVWLAFAASVAVMAGISFFTSLRGEKLRATISSPQGEVAIQRGNKTLTPQEISGLKIGDVITTGPHGRATLKYFNEATSLNLKENTELKLSGPGLGKQIELTRGKIEASVAKQPAGRPMILYTPQAKTTVVGTRFVLDARRTSTWLEMAEGAVELARNTPSRNAADRTIQVVAGQYAVVAGGLELVARPLTRELNPQLPAPVKVDLFSFFDESASWLVSDDEIRQTKVASTLRPFKMPHLEGHLEFQADVQVNEISSRNEEWGFALQVRCGQGWPSNQVVRLRAMNGSEFQLLDSISKRSSAVPYLCERGRVYHVKLRVNPEPGGKVTHLSGKIWAGEVEPENWAVKLDAPFAGPLYDIALETIHSASTFTKLKSGLIE